MKILSKLYKLTLVMVVFIFVGCSQIPHKPNVDDTPKEEPQITYPTSIPTITVTRKEINVNVNDSINLLDGVSAIGYYSDDLTSSIVVQSEIEIVDGKVVSEGSYIVNYHLMIKGQIAAIESCTVNVIKVVENVDNIKPVITINGKDTYTVGDEINLNEIASAVDNVDGVVSVSISEAESNLPEVKDGKLNEIGKFKVVYVCSDKQGNTAKATYEFEVIELDELGENLIKNADFSDTKKEAQGFTNWLVLTEKTGLKLDYEFEKGKVILIVNNYTASDNWHNQLKQVNLKIEKGKHYTLKITLKSSIERDIVLGVQNDVSWEFHLNQTVKVTNNEKEYSFDFYGRSNSTNAFFFVGLGNVNGVSASDHRVEISGLGLYETKANTNIDVKIPEGYKLVWNDEFNGEGAVDSTKWKHELGGHGWGNNELQYYTSSQKNSYQKDGNLHIAAIKENYGGRNYTSARLITQNLAEFKYGIVEAKIQLPSGGGVWPAFWMLGSNISSVSWPNCGEIDIMEGRGNIPDVILGTIHCGAYNHSIGTQKGSELYVNNSESTYNLYRLEWDETKIVISVNGIEYFKFEKPQNATFAQWPFDEEFYIILNVAMGGMFGGAVDPNFTKSEMLVDYVRVYQKG